MGPAIRLDSQFLHFFVVILSVENIPLLRAFGDDSLLSFDLLAGSCVDSLFRLEEFFEQAASFAADAIGIFDEFHLIEGGEGVHHCLGKFIHLVARDSHSTALYFWTSCCFTFLNISW